MTANDRRALTLVQTHGGVLVTTASGVGFLLYPEPKKGGKAGRWPQGMALAGGKAMRRLQQQGFITIHGAFGDSTNTYRITQKGRDALSGA